MTTIYTSRQIAEFISRQFDAPEEVKLKLVAAISLFNDRKLLSEARRAGLTILRLRAGQFILQKL